MKTFWAVLVGSGVVAIGYVAGVTAVKFVTEAASRLKE